MSCDEGNDSSESESSIFPAYPEKKRKMFPQSQEPLSEMPERLLLPSDSRSHQVTRPESICSTSTPRCPSPNAHSENDELLRSKIGGSWVNASQQIKEPTSSPNTQTPRSRAVLPTISDLDFQKNVLLQLANLNSKVDVAIDTLHSILQGVNKRVDVSSTIKLSRIGGSSVKDLVRRIMFRMLNNNVGMSFTWEGHNKKKAFKKLLLAKVIIDACRIAFPHATELEIVGFIKLWLVRCKDRETKKTLTTNTNSE